MIIRNAIITPDGTELVSETVHDYKTHTDAVTGKIYGVDGGTEYQRLIGDIDDCKVICLTTENSPIEVIRKYFTWGTYGKDGVGDYRRVKLMEMSNDHIHAILETQMQLSEDRREIFFKELEYRDIRGIFIED